MAQCIFKARGSSSLRHGAFTESQDMFKTNGNYSDKKRFLFSAFSLIVYGSVLFIGGAFLYPQFRQLGEALTSASSASMWFYGLGWLVTLLVGVLWLCCFLMFEVAKQEMLALIRK